MFNHTLPRIGAEPSVGTWDAAHFSVIRPNLHCAEVVDSLVVRAATENLQGGSKVRQYLQYLIDRKTLKCTRD